jgi:hypothetical protein
MIFFSDYDNYSMRLPYNGQGNTPLIGDVPPKSITRSPAFWAGAAIPVTWFQTSGDTTNTRYDIWVRHGAAGTWTKWLSNTTANDSVYPNAFTLGETVYFRSVATDAFGNVETDIPANGDSSTMLVARDITGRVSNLRGEPIFNAQVTASPAALNTGATDRFGQYHLYFASATGSVTISARRDGFGVLPPMRDVQLALTAPIDFVLPPAKNGINDNGFESGGFTEWFAPADSDTVKSSVSHDAAHTGDFGLSLWAASSSAPVEARGAGHALNIPADAAAPALSFVYRAPAGHPDDKLVVIIGEGPGFENRYLFPLKNEWTHVWLDVTAYRTVSAGVGFGLLGASERQVYIDEVHVGDALRGSYTGFLPTIAR